ncbi:apolipoprotein N-acyltransferase [Elusimicrobiota bacterium]
MLKKKLSGCLMSLLTGLLLILSFPSSNLFFLAWFAFIPLLLVVDNENISNSLLYGFIAGFVSSVGTLYWIVPMVELNTGSWIQAGACLLMLGIYLSLFVVLWVFLIKIFKPFVSDWVFVIFVGASWVSLEYIKTYLFTGFPWPILGYSQWNFISFIQLAEYTGVFGISFLVIVGNLLIYEFLKSRKILFYRVLIGIIVFISVFGLISVKKPLEQRPSVLVGVIQGNIDQHKKWDKAYRGEITRTYSSLVSKVSEKKPGIIIWPETAIPGYLPWDRTLLEWTGNLVKNTRAFNIVGTPYYNGNEVYHNASAVFDPGGKITQWHKKIHLVPFGEFVPLRKIFSPVFAVLNTLGDFSKGKEINALTVGQIKLGVTICSENLFGNLVRKFVKNGAEIIVNQTNDAWFLKTAAPRQHFIFNIFRAIENRRFVVVSANTGISGVIDPRGKIIRQTQTFKQDYFVEKLIPQKRITFYTLFGDVFAYLCILFVFFIIGFKIIKISSSGRTL